MKRRRSAVLVMVAAILAFGVAVSPRAAVARPGFESSGRNSIQSSEEPPTRNLEVEDRFAIKRVGRGYISPDGDWVAYTVATTELAKNASKSRIWMVETGGGDPLPMTAESRSASSPRWSPDGKYLSFIAARDEGKAQVWVLDRRGGEAQQLTEVEEAVSGYEWSPDGKRLVLLVKDPEPEGEAGEEEGAEGGGGSSEAADKTAEQAPDVPDPWVIDRLQFKRDYVGYLDRRRTHLYVFDLDSKETTQITSGDYDDGQPQWSPDGAKIAFVSNRTEEPDSNYNTDIWLVGPDNPDQGKTLVQVTSNAGQDSGPVWHPDSQQLAFTTHNQPDLSVYDQTKLAVVRVGGDNPEVLTESLDRWARGPRFSPDGDLIYFVLEERGSRHVAAIPTAGGEVTRPIAGERSVSAVEVGPDGTLVALISEPSFPGELFALDPGGEAAGGNGGEAAGGNGGNGAGSAVDGLRRLTRVNDELMAELRLAEVEKVSFNSPDGTEVETFIYKPPSFDPDFRYPTVLWIHGGPMAQHEWGFNFMAQWIAANGYVAVLPNPRGSTGYGLDFEMGIWADWGNVDRDDVLAAVDKAIELGYSDPERLAVGGWSYGGILTNYVITSTQRFKVAMSGASGALWVANYGHDQYQRWYEDEFGLPWETRELWERLSPYNKVTEITTPTMWMGGQFDWNVPIQNSEQMYQAMKRLGRETLLVVYPNQHHGIDLPVYAKDYLERVIAWYDKYLKLLPAAVRAQETVPVDLTGVEAGPIEARLEAGSLTVEWEDEAAATWRAVFSLDPEQALIRRIESEGTTLLRGGRAFYRAETGVRRKGWNAFFDYPPAHPDGTQSWQMEFRLRKARARTTGNRLQACFEGLRLGPFEGEICYTFFPGSRLIQQEAVATTDRPNVAYFYDAGLEFSAPEDRQPGGNMRTRFIWYDTEGELAEHEENGMQPERTPVRVRYRALAVATEGGGLTAFPPPHQYFFPRDFTSNLGFVWRRSWRGRVSLGVRQIADTSWQFYPWMNAPPGKPQRMSLFLLLSADGPEESLERTLAYTNRDRYPALDGYKTLSSHWHLAYTVQAMEKGFDWTPPFKPVLEEMGVDASIIMDFHGDGHPGDLTELRLEELDAFFRACRSQSDGDFLLIPSEEANVHLGGHWAVVFPKPIYWFMGRPEGMSFVSEREPYGAVYAVGDAAEMLDLVRREGGFMYQTHARTKGSTGYPDEIRGTEHFLDPSYFGAGWKAMPSDPSSPRLGERVFTLLDDMSNWGLKKKAIGEVDVFQFDHTHELYAHMNVNYVRADELPEFDRYNELLEPVVRGDFFVTTGEVLLPEVEIQPGEGDEIRVKARVRWSFPLRFAEIVWGDGERTQREIISLEETAEHGEATFQWKAQAPGWRWARVAVWDVAANGAFVNPAYRE